MYRLLLVNIALVISVITTCGQELKQGSLRLLSGVDAVGASIDFSDARVDGMKFEDYLEYTSFYDDDDDSKSFFSEARELLKDFIDEFNDTDCPLLLTASRTPRVSLTIVVKSVSRKGNEVACSYVFADEVTGTTLATVGMTSKDGSVGTFANLMSDAFERAGKDLGKYIKKQLKIAQKTKK